MAEDKKRGEGGMDVERVRLCWRFPQWDDELRWKGELPRWKKTLTNANGKIWDKWQIKNDNDKDTDKCKDNDSDKHKYNDNDKHSDNDNEHDKDTENTNTMTKIQI